jgi:hypothetical protein
MMVKGNDDYVLQFRSREGVNRDGAGAKLVMLLERLEALKPVSYGSPADGSTLRDSRSDVVENIRDASSLHIVFADEGSLRKALEIVKEMDIGLSVTLSGPLDRIRRLVSEFGFTPDSVQIGLGSFGSVPLEAETASIVTLCGHMRISPRLVRHMVDQIKAGKIGADKAAEEIGKVCRCGFFNANAASKILGS